MRTPVLFPLDFGEFEERCRRPGKNIASMAATLAALKSSLQSQASLLSGFFSMQELASVDWGPKVASTSLNVDICFSQKRSGEERKGFLFLDLFLTLTAVSRFMDLGPSQGLRFVIS